MGEERSEIVSSDDTNKDEIVSSDDTNTTLACKVFRELLLFYETNINLKRYRREHPKLVSRLETIIISEEAGKIARYIGSHPVFTIPVLRALEDTTKPHSYKTVRQLMEMNVVKRTHYRVVSPTPGTRGPKPMIHTLTDIELLGSEDPRIKEAQTFYNETHERYDPAYTYTKQEERRLIPISLEVVDYFKGRGRVGGNRPVPLDVALYLRANYPDLSGPQIADFARKISHSLYKESLPHVEQKVSDTEQDLNNGPGMGSLRDMMKEEAEGWAGFLEEYGLSARDYAGMDDVSQETLKEVFREVHTRLFTSMLD